MSFPVAGTLMVEPTESEDLAELDRFCDAMIAIRDEIRAVEAGEWAVEDSPLRHAPHPAADVVVDEWDRSVHARAGRVPGRCRPRRAADKYWPPVSRIDGAYGDRNLMCSCPPLSAYEDDGDRRTDAMARPQPGIFAQGTRSHYHLEFDLRAGVDRRRDPSPRSAVCASRRSPPAAPTSSSASVPTCGGGCGPTTRRPSCADFEAVEGDGRRAPATQHDLWVWTHGTGEDVELDIARARSSRCSRPSPTLAAEQPCFVYLDSRDLTGFIDGTENPPVEEAFDVALVADGEPGAGGAFVLAQKWVHDLGEVPCAVAHRAGGHHRPHQARQRRARRQARHRAHRARRHRGGRRGARDLPAQHAVRAGGGAGPLLPRVQRRSVALRQDAAPDVRHQRRRSPRPPDRLHARR